MENNITPVRLENIPAGPNDFVPELLPVNPSQQDPVFNFPQAPESPESQREQQPGQRREEEEKQKEASKQDEPTGVNPDIASLFGEQVKVPDVAKEGQETKSLSKAQLFDRLLSDEGFRRAFINKYEPGMVKTIDPEASAMQKLQEEFGTDFVNSEFNVQEAGIPGTKSFKYIKKYNQYVTEAEQQQKQAAPQDFEQIVKDYQMSVERENQKLQTEKLQCMRMYNWDEPTFDGFINFASKLGLVDLGYIYNKAILAKQGAGPRHINPIINAPGNANNQNQYQEMVNTFGPPISS